MDFRTGGKDTAQSGSDRALQRIERYAQRKESDRGDQAGIYQLRPEQHYFDEYYQTYAQAPQENLKRLSSQQILNLWLEYEQHAEHESRLGLLKKLSIMFRFNLSALKIFLQSPELVIPYLQRQFYVVRQRELTEERIQLEQRLANYSFSEKMEELTEKSLRLFRAELSNTYQWKEERRTFEMRDFRGRSNEFNREYPVVLSTTYSIKGTLNIDHIYDYLIVDEASQVDLATGVLAFACARNIVIVGDLQQLPNVLNDRDIQTSEAIWNRYSLPEVYHFPHIVCYHLLWWHGRRHPRCCCGSIIAVTPRSLISAIRNSMAES